MHNKNTMYLLDLQFTILYEQREQRRSCGQEMILFKRDFYIIMGTHYKSDAILIGAEFLIFISL